MAVETMSDPRSNLPNVYTNVTARKIDFVNRFGNNWDGLRNIIGISRPIRKAPGTSLVSYSASVTLTDGDVDAGEVIPYSKHTIVQSAVSSITVKKYAHAVTLEEIADYGADIAIEKSDAAFLNELQSVVLSNFYTFLNTGTLTDTAETFQMGLAKARGLVLDKFNKMRKSVTEVVGFANVLDFYDYLGAANITVQTEFGLTYIKNFMGYSTLFLLSAPDIVRGKVIAVPVENINLYYVDPADSEFARSGLVYTVQGETNLIGIHMQGNYNTAVSESYAIMGMTLWAEYLDGIANVTVTGVLPELDVTSVAGTSSGKTAITYSGYTLGTGDSLGYKVTDDAIVVTKGASSSGFTSWNGSAEITAATNKILTLVVINDSKIVAGGNTTVTAHA